MEEELIITLPKPLNQKNISIRTKNYIRVYSAQKSKPRDQSSKDFKGSELNCSHRKKNSDNVSGVSFNNPSIYSLEQTAKSLLYDIQKAASDKYEIMRDTSTFDYNFSNEKGLLSTFKQLHEISKPLPDSSNLIRDIIMQESSFYNSLLKGITNISSLKTNLLKDYYDEIEYFGIKKKNSAQKLNTVYKGNFIISGVRSIVSLTSDKWLENLHFSTCTLDGFKCNLKTTQNTSTSYYTSSEITNIVKKKLLPCLSYGIKNDEIFLIFDPYQNKNYYNMLSKIRGYKTCIVRVTIKNESNILLEVPGC
jgi:hypothetical protein